MKRLFCILSLLCMMGCNPAGKFSVINVEKPVMNGLASVHGRLTVESEARYDFMVESASITLKYKGRELATARLMLPIEVPAGDVTGIRWDFALENTSLAALGTLQTRLLANPGQFTVDVACRIRRGGIGKKIVLEDLPIDAIMQIISNFGVR